MSADRMVEVPHRLADVADPCTERYYPEWSSRGMRAVRCTRPAKATLVEPNGLSRRICGVHVRRYERLRGWRVVRDSDRWAASEIARLTGARP